MNSSLRINPDRFRADFDALAQFGATGDGGVNRPTFSPAHLAARAWFAERVRESGLEFRVDGAGNHSAFLPSSQADAPILLLGSHLDSVPYGGRFDGALGVLAALEVLRVIRESGLAPRMNLEAIDFTDEEGTLVGLLGSAALAGRLTRKDLEQPRGGRETPERGMASAGLSIESMLSTARPPESLAGYLELHIEQGRRLLDADVDIGVVTSIVGICSYRLAFLGRADHAGTTSMQDRLDAAQGASAFAVSARELVLQDFPTCVVNVGRMDFSPGAFNIVPERVVVSLEFRAPEAETFQQLEEALLALAAACADRFGLGLESEFVGRHAPTPMSESMQALLAQSAEGLGLSHKPLTSGAGHDGQSLAGLCPVGMLFVPSVGGASHAPRELTEWQDCVNGANVLLQAAAAVAA